MRLTSRPSLPPHPRSQTRSPRRRAQLIGAVSIAAVVALAGCSSSDDGDKSSGAKDTTTSSAAGTTAGTATTSDRGLPTASAMSMLLPESSFPGLPNGEFEVGDGSDSDDDDAMTSDNPVCNKIFNEDDSEDLESADRSLTSTRGSSASDVAVTSYQVGVAKGADPSDLEDIDRALASCDRFTLDLGDDVTAELTLDSADIDADGDARAMVMNGTADMGGTTLHMTLYMVAGIEREVGITAMSMYATAADNDTEDTTDILADLYNEQRQRVLDAD